MVITTIVIAAVAAGAGGGGLIAKRIRRSGERRRKLEAEREAEAAAGRREHPTAYDLLSKHGFEILDGRPRPVPQMRGKIALKRAERGNNALSCEFTHDAIWRARREHLDEYDGSPDYKRYRERPSYGIFLLEQVVSDGVRAEYRPILQVCQLCLHVYPMAEASLEGTSFEGRVAGRQSLHDVVAEIDAVTLLDERRARLRDELGEVEGKLLNAAYASPKRLADHPHRGHPLRLVAGTTEAALDDPPDDRAKAMPALKDR